MKKIIFILCLSSLSFLFQKANAQQLIINNTMVQHEDQPREAVLVQMEPSTDKVKEAFKDYLKDNYDVKLKGFGVLSNKDILSREEIEISTISDKTMNFYAEIIEGEVGTDMKVFASLGYDIYINSEDFPKEYNAIHEIVDNFVADFLPNYYSTRIDKTKNKIEDLKKQQDKLEDNIADNKGDIKKMTEEIEELRKENLELADELTKNETNLTKANATLQTRKMKFEQIKEKVDDEN